jgi:DNA transformation protein
MVASATYNEFLRELLAPLGRVTMRRIFGKTGVFCDGLMFGDGDGQHALLPG